MKYRIVNYSVDYTYDSDEIVVNSLVQMKLWFFWITIRKFVCVGDNAYALRCAEELLDKLTEDI